MTEMTVCAHHVGAVDRKAVESLAERLRQGGDEAVAKLRQLIRDPDISPEVQVRAAEILLSRVAPKLSSRDAVVVHVDGNAEAGGLTTMERLEARWERMLQADKVRAATDSPDVVHAQLVDAASEAQAQAEALAWKSAPPLDEDDQVVEAELVPQPVVVEQPAQPYGVPRTSRRPGDLQRLVERQSAWMG